MGPPSRSRKPSTSNLYKTAGSGLATDTSRSRHDEPGNALDSPTGYKRTQLDCPPLFKVSLNMLRFHQISRSNESFHTFLLSSPVNLTTYYYMINQNFRFPWVIDRL